MALQNDLNQKVEPILWQEENLWSKNDSSERQNQKLEQILWSHVESFFVKIVPSEQPKSEDRADSLTLIHFLAQKIPLRTA